MRLRLESVAQAYGATGVLDGIDLVVEPGRIGCLLGPSGCGKTTVLRCIAGFEALSAGRITVGERTVSGEGVHVAPEERGVGMVFQHYALFPHLNVADNVGFGLRGHDRQERDARVADMLEVTGLGAAAGAWPHELSGGERQRVALARALAPRPGVLLLDEPFSNLDQDLRHRLGAEVRDILRAMGTTALMVTHDQHEAFAVADDVAVLRGGRVEQCGRPWDLYHSPETRFVAGFIGQGAFLPGELVDDDIARIELGDLRVRLPAPVPRGARVDVLLRPEDVVHDDDSAVTARVLRRDFRGADVLMTLELPSGGRVLSRAPASHEHGDGSAVGIRLVAGRVAAFAVGE